MTDLADKEIARYEYDETNLRSKKIVGSKSYEYYYGNDNLTLEIIKENNNILEYRYYQWNGNTPLGMIVKKKGSEGNWKEKIFHYWTNQRGNVISIRDNSNNEIGSYTYDVIGNVLDEKGEIAKYNTIRYAGYYYDHETKNYYLQARFYNPENGSFLALPMK
ncbi:RHS repeat-associated core domain-containing protein [Viridibacillus sp. FSL R5-0468]|uniref:RHS repeat domain-containing protein n=1 Tax=unclassified Viridibacillus TaxID=2617942 RepID=UPI00117DF7BB|nr:RHS repeat-associated core domain-containing protein [Viridibacillus sp. FSL H7-0596]